MKIYILLGGLFITILFFISFGHAASYTCPASQTIMRLYNPTNTHGALWNETEYDTQVCYNQLFGINYKGSNPHNCTGLNKVVGLYAATNAHAEEPSLNNYPVSVCYGNLNCRASTGNANSGERLIVSLYQPTNSHLSLTDSAYKYHIYCSSGIPSAVWENFIGKRISESYVGNWVKLKAGGFFSGENVTFKIERVGIFSHTKIAYYSAITNTLGDADVWWGITQNDMVSGKTSSDFTFTADGNDSGLSQSSNTLTVYNRENNTIPNLTIMSPEDGQIYFAGVNLTFNAPCVDKEGPTNITWDINDNGIHAIKKGNNFNYMFSQKGQKIITVDCHDQQGSDVEKQINILEIASPGLHTYINKPFYHETVINNTLSVKYNASKSYIINNQLDKSCIGKIQCLAGNCPGETKNYPSSCAGDVLVNGSPKPFTNVYFNLTFEETDNNGNMKTLANVGGLGNVEGVVNYGFPSFTRNDKLVNLTISYNQQSISLTQQIDNSFTLLGPNGGCMPSLGEYLVINQQGFLVNQLNLNDPGACSLVGGSGCCQAGFVCNTPKGDSSNKATCIQPIISSNFTACGDYTNQSSCLADQFHIAGSAQNPERTANPACGFSINGSIVQCGECIWNGASQTDGTCQLKKTIPYIVPAGNNECIPSCPTSAKVIQDCSSGVQGYKKIELNKTFQTTGTCDASVTAQKYGCVNQEVNVKCIEGVRLPFFEPWQLIFGMISIVVLYGFYILKK